MKKNLLFLVAIVFLGTNANLFAQGGTCATATTVMAGSHTDPGILLEGGAFAGACTPVTDGTNANWYSYTPDADYLVTVSSCLGGTDTHLSILTGDCGTLTCVAGNDDFCEMTAGSNAYASEVVFSATAGTTYYIEWQDRWSADGFDWSLTEGAPLACDIIDMTFIEEECADGDADGIFEPGFSFVANFTGEGCQVEDITWTINGADTVTINAPGAGFFINSGDTVLFGTDLVPADVYVFSYTLNDGDISGNYTYTVGDCDDVIAGCMDTMACNYDSTATNDDGSCTYPGCSDSSALNFEPELDCIDDTTCLYAEQECGSTFTDLGGIDGDYAINADVYFYACPDSMGHVVTVDFTEFNIEANYDFLTIYNGADSTATVIGTYSGPQELGSFTSTDPSGCLTFHFTSDASVIASGWVANVSCAPAPDCITPSAITASDVTDMSAMISWIGSTDTASTHMIEIVPSGDTPTGVGMMADNPYMATDLMAGTMYDVYVMTDCGENGMTEWVGPTTFTTVDCAVYTGGPWTDFNTAGGAPMSDPTTGECTPVTMTFGAWANEIYTIDNFVGDEEYTFSICDGTGAGSWNPELTVFDGDMNIIAGPTAACSITFTAPADGTYLIGINEEGVCGPTTTNTAVDNGFPSLTCTGNVSISEVEELLNVSIFPNPTEDVLNIKIDGLNQSKTIVNIVSLQGRTILSNEFTFNNAIETLDVSSIATGIYMVEIINGNSISTKKVVIK